MKKKIVINLLIFILPWSLRRLILNRLLGYQIHSSAFISRFSIIAPEFLEMDKHAKIGAFNVAIHLTKFVMGDSAVIGRSNWISGFQKGSKNHFAHAVDRDPSLIMGEHSAITKKHIIDCTDKISIGKFSTIAGYHSQFLTHSIDYELSRQDCHPIAIGEYSIVGTGSVFLPGSALPSYSICGAGSVVNKVHTVEYSLYAGTPAGLKKQLNKDAKYFIRDKRYVD